MTQKEKKLWGGRFQEKASSILERIGESVSFDHKLYKEDIQGSIAHARMLQKIGILTKEELSQIETSLAQIRTELEEGKLEFKSELEDIHMHIESRLTELIGETGKKLHTARSRNDQVTQDVRLFILNQGKEILRSIFHLRNSLYEKAKQSLDVIIPGYTHLQVAQPIRASQYLLSWFWALERDQEFLRFALLSSSELALGSGAMAGVNYPTDREFLKKELGLSKVSHNSMDGVASRDHILQFLFAASQLMIHASRICEDIILYSSQEFGILKLPDSLTTGSSIMPQKKNPDIAELIRGKSGRVIGNLNHILVMLKGLPSTYNRDLQEDKLALFDSIETVQISLEGIQAMIEGWIWVPERAEASLKNGFATATDLADFLVGQKKIPFRTAHELVGTLVGICVEKKRTLFDLPETDRISVSEHFAGKEYEDAVSLSLSADKKISYGGTSRERQEEQLKIALESLKEAEKWLL
ncbi:argininosuccinate lyase [Leptospira stimsonii]|uniref:Argininosuccinate lyase n=1 Tax=Leptospira stimsonii TaxID=2202203 RepID=A0ABY2MY21_9LEPT|nr:argininosuccinate lyase [Leptospira stimsonii]TGK14328.1 argininosuccinate lyase [Leptospira stimsonii]TGM11691.1 argininosuccinate lyase [Leptospira stimsonii]